MTLYMLTVNYPEGSTMPSPEEMAEIARDVDAVHAEVRAAGAWVFGGALYPASTATVVTAGAAGSGASGGAGDVVVTDGPFAESREQIGGFSVVDVADLDAALAIAARLAAACRVPIEVRPFVDGAA
jgi:hypothetical protein